MEVDVTKERILNFILSQKELLKIAVKVLFYPQCKCSSILMS